MSAKLTENQLVKLKEVFSLYDKDNDGLISTTEITAAMKQLGHNLSEEEIRGIVMKEGDTKGKGTIDLTGLLDLLPLKPYCD